MFKDFKSQFLWCIMCTFITGFVCGSSITLIDYKYLNITFIILSFLSVLFTIIYWKIIFKRLNLQDKINSIYTDID